MVSSQLVLFGPNTLEAQEIEAAADGLSWDVLDALASGFTALIQINEVSLGAIDQALLEISELRDLSMTVQAEPNYIYYATAKPANY